MNEKDKKRLIKSLKKAKESGFKDPLHENPKAKRELYVGQLRKLKFEHLNYIKRKEYKDEELDFELDQYNKRKKN